MSVAVSFTSLTTRAEAGVRRALLDLNKRIVPEPAGSVKMFAGATAPDGYLLCAGGTASRTGQAALFAAIGTTWGVGDGSTTFGLPDLRDRLPIGAGTSYSLAATGGSKDAIVVSHGHADTFTTANQSASHKHSVSGLSVDIDHGHADNISISGGDHAHNFQGQYSVWHQDGSLTGEIISAEGNPPSGHAWYTATASASHTHTVNGGVTALNQANESVVGTLGNQDTSHSHTINGSVTDAGSSGTDKNLPPYAALNYIIKT